MRGIGARRCDLVSRWQTIDPHPGHEIETSVAEVQISGDVSLNAITRVDLGAEIPADLRAALGAHGIPTRNLVLPAQWRPFLVELFTRSPGYGSACHGARHWLAVATNALTLAQATDRADPYVCVLFALLHGAARTSETDEPEHGQAAGHLMHDLEPLLPRPLSDDDHDLLLYALIYHDQGQVFEQEPTIAVCWDADRLDLPRVGITPDPALLSTAAGSDRIGTPTEPLPLAQTLRTLEAHHGR